MAAKPAIKTKQVTYIWQGVNKKGETIKGETNASSITLVKADLRRQGIVAKKVRKKAKPLISVGNKKISQQDISIFSRQMATMLSSGIPLVQAFDIVGKGLTNPRMTELVATIKADVESGTTFYEALAKHPKYFNELYCNLVEAGEQSGSLDTMLANIATYKEKMLSLLGKIKKALFYPTAVIVIAIVVTAALLIFVVPQFESLFKGFGADLPAMTRMVITLSEFFQAYWWLIFGTMGGLVWAFFHAKQTSPKFAHQVDKALLRIPVLGAIFEKASIARFSRTLAITFAAGVPLVEALKTVAGSTGNILFANATHKIREEVATGTQLQVAMKATNMFPNMVIQMIAIGEESGTLEKMLTKVADFYEEEVDNMVDGLSSLIEPFIMAILGVLVGGLVVAMYLPIFKLGNAI